MRGPKINLKIAPKNSQPFLEQGRKETLALILANFFRLPAAANRLKVDKNSATRRIVLIFENAAFGLFWNKATKIKTKISL